MVSGGVELAGALVMRDLDLDLDCGCLSPVTLISMVSKKVTLHHPLPTSLAHYTLFL